ncbi:MAG: anthranilate synthase component I [Candidatus Freyarchaeota archaeon]|nr:anthranilate synthase component I [Candidatus Jordarchaeia archaeon]MBS7267602.1 anthranilate synthase component I [Candidatus Jordarchaeia archaeon]MBS7278809.1 anthranilate synthase component I [Candidatus Jordarchaeia archaeon]
MKKFPTDLSPTQLFLKIHQKYQYAYLLESMEGPKKLAQFSFLGFMPQQVVTSKNGQTTIQDIESGEKTKIKSSNPLQVVEKVLGRNHEGHLKSRFVGGAVGYISYDSIRYWERLPNHAIDDLKYPDLQMAVYNDGVVFDHIHGETLYYYRGQDRSQELAELTEPNNQEDLSFTDPKVNITKERYEEAVEKAKKYVVSGDVFQVVLSKRFDFRFRGDLTRFYLALREINPSPYMYFLKMGDRQIVGSSPEMLVRVERDSVETFPIAGTRPRVEDPIQNRALAEELLMDEKERAEHVMLVDLARNDLGKVSRFGSVHVPEFMQVHECSHVQHIVSRVVGKLREDCSCYDALRAVFPAGTVSGAPKVRAMEIIEELEPTRRGPYAGAVGYFSYNGNMDFAITIRTLVADRSKCFIQVGAGIVADSVPEKEWFETEHKAKALLKALEMSEGGKL